MSMSLRARHRLLPSSAIRKFVVDPIRGHDSNSGWYRAPWRTVAHAIGAIGDWMAWGAGDPLLTLVGRCPISATLNLTPSNTGIRSKTLTIGGTKDGTSSISAAVQVTGWTVYSGTIHQALYAGNAPLNLWVNGVRYQQAERGVGIIGTPTLTSTGYTAPGESILTDPNPSHVRMGYYGTFLRPQNRVISVAGNNIAMVQLAHTRITSTPGYAYHFWDSWLGYDNAARPSYIWNVWDDFVTAGVPGTFYADSTNGLLYICPFLEHDLGTAQVLVPIGLETVLVADGATDVTITNNVRLEHANYGMEDGFVERDIAEGYFDGSHTPIVTGPLSGPGAGDYTNLDQSVPAQQSLPAAVVVKDSTRIRFSEYARIQHHAALGISFEGVNVDCTMYGMAVDDVGSVNIRIGTASQATNSTCSTGILIQHCKITNGGREFLTGTGIDDVFMSNSRIEYCEIAFQPYCGISSSVGATVNYSWWDKRVNNKIRYNLIHDVMMRLVDGAGIYTSGTDHDDLDIVENYIYNVGNAFPFPGTLVMPPLYFDQFAGHKVLSGNVAVARSGQPIMLVNDNGSPNANQVLTNYGNTGTVQVIGNAPDVNTAFTVATDVLSIFAAAAIAAAAGPALPYRSNL